ncbi:MAG: hypothetical protein KY469_14390 [Actinobacteria bacterium]|nr:hypothetical protein [Actinomycetota bacterium]
MRDLPIIVVPRCLTNLGHDTVRTYVDDALDELISALSRDSEARAAGVLIEPDPEEANLTYSGGDLLEAAQAFQDDYLDRGWGDGFPLIPPTDEKVEAMFAATPLARDHVVAALQPGLGAATVEKLAVNAVMAGCRPEHLPVLIAAVEAMSDPVFNLRDVAMSTGPHAPLIVINGPIARELGVNSGRGALGPGRQSRVNTVIGRALRLILMNVGKCYLEILDLDTIGSPKKYGMCLAENEAASPWVPLHVERGFDGDDNIVTVFSVESEIEVYDFYNYHAEPLLRTFAGTATSSGACSVQLSFHNRPEMHNLILLAPEHAEVFANDGWDKERIRQELFTTARREWSWIGAAQDPQSVRKEWKWVVDQPDQLVPVTRDPRFFHVCVVGGAAGKSQYLTGLGAPASRPILTP